MSIVFVSYRRADSEALADRVGQRLLEEFGHGAVFFDRDALPLGIDWRDGIREELAICKVMVVIIGPDWLSEVDGRTRLDDPNDWVRFEVEHALYRGIPTIPVLVGDVGSMPADESLPKELRPLTYRQHVNLSTWEEANVERLITGVTAAAKHSWTAKLVGSLPSDRIEIRARLTYDEHLLVLNWVPAAGKFLFHRVDGRHRQTLNPDSFLLPDGSAELPAQFLFRSFVEAQLLAARFTVDERCLLEVGAWS